MIYYYSATGNTRYAARFMAEMLNTEALNILELEIGYRLKEGDDPIGFMFPIYCWGVPPVAAAFFAEVFPQLTEDRYVWSACTCGDEAGTAMSGFDKRLRKARGRGADALWSVIMPNTYVLLPGFDVDKPEVEETKLREAPARLERIAASVEARESGIFDVQQGSFPSLRSAIFPLFERWGVFPGKWKASADCIGCGKCANICPARNIVMEKSRPRWSSRCFSCCACFHCCPVKAISYGDFTKGKSQYLCPL